MKNVKKKEEEKKERKKERRRDDKETAGKRKEEDEEENEVYYIGEGSEDEGVKRKRKLEEMLRRLQEASGVNSNCLLYTSPSPRDS